MNWLRGLIVAGGALLLGIALAPKRESNGIGSKSNIDDSHSFEYEAYPSKSNPNESRAKAKITRAIREIMNMKDEFGRNLYACPYIGATSDAVERLDDHNSERRSEGKKEFSKLFILTTLTSKIKGGRLDWRSAKAKTEELEEDYIEKMKLELNLENISDKSTGLVDGAEKYCIYIAVCDAN